MIEVKILADSINPIDIRITTMQLTYPRYIHSEFMTHRVFSRNAASSRAIPFDKMVSNVKENTAYPVKWGLEQKGMQSGDEVSDRVQLSCEAVWENARDYAIAYARQLHDLGIHKSICNRLLEPFMHITTIVTATEWENFFKLRNHPEAEPTFQQLAYMMLLLYSKNKPTFVDWNDWHIPFGDKSEGLTITDKIKVATARCARLSYNTHDGDFSFLKDIALHDSLLTNRHFSPFEHCAQAVEHTTLKSNFHPSWLQYRKFFNFEDGKNNTINFPTSPLTARP